MPLLTLTGLSLAVSFCGGCKDSSIGQGAQPPSPAYVFNWTKIADSSSTALNTNFWNANRAYYNSDNQNNAQFQYWPQAHALDVLVDAYTRTKDGRYLANITDWFVGVNRGNGNTFLNAFYDDMGWNALAMLRAYDATNDANWLTATQTVWTDIKGGWNTQMGGGIAWQKNQLGYKNTPANAPAIILAARLYQRLKQPSDLDWATRIYAWQMQTLVNATSGFVYDGINRQNDGKVDLTWAFTYNQGLMIGAGLEMYRATNTQSYLDDAIKTANNAIVDPTLTAGGLMRDEGGGDGGLFKGVLVRYLTLLATEPAVPAATRARYVAFLTFNAQTLWRQGTTRPALLYGTNWANPPGTRTDLTTQLSGAMLMEAMTRLR